MATTIREQIDELIQKEVEKTIDRKLTKYLEYISKKYDISLKLLLQDFVNMEDGLLSPREVPSGSGQCLGMMANRRRCNFAGKYDGYCKKHFHQKKVSRPTTIVPPSTTVIIEHTHTFQECLYKKGCPACEKNKKVPSSENLLIDFI
jgi:hypothetical protein